MQLIHTKKIQKIPNSINSKLLSIFIHWKCKSAILLIFIVFMSMANAENYPERPIRLIVPTGPAGPTDLVARLLADKLSLLLGQPILIDNKVGAGGAIGARYLSQSIGDGYTLMVGNTATLANIPAVSKTPGYDPNSSFTGVAKIMDSFQVLVTSNDFPAENINDLVHLLKSNSSKMNFSAAGVGNLTHLSGELFKNKSNTNFEIIQYKSGAESINSILSGQTQFTIDNISIVKPLIMDKKLKALAVTSTVRQSDLPSTPTMKEAGFQDLIITSFFGVVAPIATPKSIVQKLNKAINEVITTNFMVDQFKRLGGQVSPESPEQFQNFIANEILKWSNIANQSGLKVE